MFIDVQFIHVYRRAVYMLCIYMYLYTKYALMYIQKHANLLWLGEMRTLITSSLRVSVTVTITVTVTVTVTIHLFQRQWKIRTLVYKTEQGMYGCMWIYVCMYKYVCIYVYTNKCTCVYVYVCIQICMHNPTSRWKHMHM
jgi:hypothetical protein